MNTAKNDAAAVANKWSWIQSERSTMYLYWTAYCRGVGAREKLHSMQCCRIVQMNFPQNMIPQSLQFFISETTSSIASKFFDM